MSYFKLIFRVTVSIISAIGVVLLLDISSGEIIWEQFTFYTFQSNLIIFFFYSTLSIKSIQTSIHNKKICNYDVSSDLSGAMMLMIVVTGLIFNFVLAPFIPDNSAFSPNSLTNFISHIIVPFLVFLDWIFFSNPKHLSKYAPFKWVIIPLIYWVFAIVRAITLGPIKLFKDGSRYPYFFIDHYKLGWLKVFRNVILLAFGFIILGYCFIIIAKAINYLTKRKEV